jgi:hypothetical protein
MRARGKAVRGFMPSRVAGKIVVMPDPLAYRPQEKPRWKWDRVLIVGCLVAFVLVALFFLVDAFIGSQ